MDRENPIRKTRVVGVVLCTVTAGILLALWVRSYTYAERVHGWLAADRCFLVASTEGRVTLISFPPAFHPGHWPWELRKAPVDSEFAFPNSRTRIDEWGLGFGRISDPMYSLHVLLSGDSSTNARPIDLQPARHQYVQAYADFVIFHGTGLVVPYWSLVVSSVLNAFALWTVRTLRFSIRTLFVTVTLVAILLGAVQFMNN